MSLLNGARYLKRGDTRDPECHRMTYRLEKARAILRGLGIEPTWQHSDRRGVVGTGLLMREAHVCDDRCRAVWPAWATDEVFNLAYRLADEVQTKRGEHGRARAAALKAEQTMPACAWCGKPGKVFVTGNAHCGGSHAALAR